MGYIPGFQYDVFFSYSHRDNEPLPLVQNASGWISALVETLEIRVARELGRREYFETWLDRDKFRGHEQIDSILERVAESATLLVVLSNGWLESKDCRLELDAFVKAHTGDEKLNIFVVKLSKLNDERLVPEVLNRVPGYQFWYVKDGTPITFGDVNPPATNDKDFNEKTVTLAIDMANEFRALAQRGGKDTMVRDPAGPTILLAEATDDVDKQRDDVRKFLDQYRDQYRIAVVPLAPYPRPGLAKALDADLANCRLFVQLLGQWPGRRSEEAPRGYPWLQYERARDLKIQILQWRSPELELGNIETSHRELLERETVQATSLTQFEQEILRCLKEKPQQQPVEHSVFIDHDRKDEQAALKIRDALSDVMDVSRPKASGGAETIRKDRRDKMLEAESLVFLYGDVKQSWIDSELNAFKAIRHERTQPAHKQIVLEAPPTPKNPPSVVLKGMETLKADKGIDEQVIDRLKTQLLR
jgi:hypothetical protein